MIVTIVETGQAPEPIRADFDSYPVRFQKLLNAVDDALTFETVSVVDGDSLPDPTRLSAVLITGSPFGVYDDTPWMRPLKEWIGFAADARTPTIGICFGHQIIADALGGDVGKSDNGWGLGRHTYDVIDAPDWMTPLIDPFSVSVSHQDQVRNPPPTARTIARSDFCAHAALVYTHAPIMSFQGHPEFEDDFTTALFNARRGTRLSHAQVDAAEASLNKPHHNTEIAQWMANFLSAHA